MHCIIYQFNVLENRAEDFIKYWTAVTEQIYQEKGSLGSRLHQSHENIFIGYAQWPSKEVYNASGNSFSKESALRQNMRDCCSNIETLFALDVVSDLFQKKH